MITIKNTQRVIVIDIEAIKQQVQHMLSVLKYDDFDLGIWFTTNITIRKYNKMYRNKDKATDILSFPYHAALKAGMRINPIDDDDKNLGDLIISAQYAMNDAQEKWERSFDEHLIALLAHGICHVLGYDHIIDKDFVIMQKMEKKLIRAVQAQKNTI